MSKLTRPAGGPEQVSCKEGLMYSSSLKSCTCFQSGSSSFFLGFWGPRRGRTKAPGGKHICSTKPKSKEIFFSGEHAQKTTYLDRPTFLSCRCSNALCSVPFLPSIESLVPLEEGWMPGTGCDSAIAHPPSSSSLCLLPRSRLLFTRSIPWNSHEGSS